MEPLLEVLKSNWGTAGVAAMLLMFLVKVIDENKVREAAKRHGKFVSASMSRSKLGKMVWESLESFCQKIGMAYLLGFFEGADIDDAEQKPVEPKSVEPPQAPKT